MDRTFSYQSQFEATVNSLHEFLSVRNKVQPVVTKATRESGIGSIEKQLYAEQRRMAEAGLIAIDERTIDLEGTTAGTTGA